jgi:hypothetical protein
MEALASYLTDFVGRIDASTRGVVSQHIQMCIAAVADELKELEARLKQYEAGREADKEGPVPPLEVKKKK